MQKHQSLTLRQAITRMMLVVSGSVLTTTTLVLVIRLFLAYESSVHTSLASLSKVISQNLVAPLVFSDEKEIQKVIDTVHGDPKIKGAIVYSAGGDIVAHSFEDKTLPSSFRATLFDSRSKSQIFVSQFDRVYLCDQILENANHIGSLCLFYQEKIFINELVQMFGLAVFILILGIFVSYFLSGYFQRQIQKPIDRLLSATRKVRETGDFTVTASAAIGDETRVEELEHLNAEFNHMLASIKDKESEILEINRNLETNITQRTQELEAERASAIERSRMVSLGEMAGGVAHEINNPLAIINGYAGQIVGRIDSGKATFEGIKGQAQKIMLTVDRIAKIILGLRSFARDGAQDPFAVTPLETIVNETLSFSEARIKNRGIELSTELPQTPVFVECRAVQISQILLNLLNNAVDAIENNSEKWIKLSVEDVNEFVNIRITDSGKGIPPEIAEKILQPFFTTKPVGKGTGLGLSIAAGIVKAHHGEFFLDKKSPNTSFVVQLPKEQSQARAKAA